MSDIDAAIATYRAKLAASADIARGDLDEIEDHLRALTAELQTTGLTGIAAVTEAARRLGEPHAIAAEHARVSAGFGQRLTRARAWSAVVLAGVPLAAFWGHTAHGAFDLALAPVVLGAIAFRLSWARAWVLGLTAFMCASQLFVLAVSGASQMLLVTLAASVAVLATLAPWRRGELSAAGWALALMGPGLGAADVIGAFAMTAPGGAIIATALPMLVLAGVAIGTAGGLLRARWGAFGAVVVVPAIALVAYRVWPLTMRFTHPDLYRAWLLGTLAVGGACVGAAAAIMWRTARSNLGSLRALAR